MYWKSTIIQSNKAKKIKKNHANVPENVCDKDFKRCLEISISAQCPKEYDLKAKNVSRNLIQSLANIPRKIIFLKIKRQK